MTPRNESKRQSMRDFLENYLQRDVTYRAGSIYEAYLNEGSSAEITRKDFEMFLRDQVIKDDGLLKRVSHGVYEIRTNPPRPGHTLHPREPVHRGTGYQPCRDLG